jgi:hypothetical protein
MDLNKWVKFYTTLSTWGQEYHSYYMIGLRLFCNLCCCFFLGGKVAPGSVPPPPNIKGNAIDIGVSWFLGVLTHYWFTGLLLSLLIGYCIRDMRARGEGPWPFGADWWQIGLSAGGVILAERYYF